MIYDKYNWEDLKQEFFKAEFAEAFTFIQHRFSTKKAQDGNMKKHITGWSEEKKIWKREMLEKAKKKAEEELMEKLKISLEDLLLNKRLLFSLDAKYLEIMGRLTNNEDPPSKEEMRFFGSYEDKIRDIFKRIQIELGLPINIEELQGRKEKPLVFIDLIRQAEQAEKDAKQSGNNSNNKGGQKEPSMGD